MDSLKGFDRVHLRPGPVSKKSFKKAAAAVHGVIGGSLGEPDRQPAKPCSNLVNQRGLSLANLSGKSEMSP
jgi:hypothetical protein